MSTNRVTARNRVSVGVSFSSDGITNVFFGQVGLADISNVANGVVSADVYFSLNSFKVLDKVQGPFCLKSNDSNADI